MNEIMIRSRHILVCIGVGGAIGRLLSITPAIIVLPVLIAAIIVWVHAVRSPRFGPRRLIRILCPASSIAVVFIATLIPIKPLDKKIGPLDYPVMPIAALAASMGEDYGIQIDTRHMANTNLVVLVSKRIGRYEKVQCLTRSES